MRRVGVGVRVVLPIVVALAVGVVAAPLPLSRAPAASRGLEQLAAGYDDGATDRPLLAVRAALLLAVGALVGLSIARALARDLSTLAATSPRDGAATLDTLEVAHAAASAIRARSAGRVDAKAPAPTAADDDAVDDAGRARRERLDLLAAASHDLRSPLNSILGFSELLLRGLDGDVAEADRQPLVAIQSRGRRLLALLNEILDAAKCEAGKMSLELRPLEPAALVDEALEELGRTRRTDEARPIRTEVAPRLRPVMADPVRLPQAVAHLLAHAVATTDSPITLRLFDRKGGGVRQLVAEVSHVGAPVGADWERALFALHRLAPSDLGLALPLARRFAELHGGSLVIDSSPDPTPIARYTLTIPAAPRPAKG